MTHQPNKLALLISLIGAGVSPYACARASERVVGVAQVALDMALEAPAATALDRTRWSPGLAWRVEEGAFDVPEPLQGLRAAGSFSDEWTPGEMHERPQPMGGRTLRATPTELVAALLARAAAIREDAETAAAQSEFATSKAAKPEAADAGSRPASFGEVRGVKSGPEPAARDRLHRKRARQGVSTKRETIEAESSTAIARSALLPVPEDAGTGKDDTRLHAPAANAKATSQSVATVRFSVPPLVRPDVEPVAVPAAGLMEARAAIALEDGSASSGDLVLTNVAEQRSAPIAEPPASGPRAGLLMPGDAATARLVERRKIVVATHSNKVLRTLEAILSNERDEVGAIRAEPSEKIVATQVDKVLATLLEVASARDALEDGAAQGERRHAAAKLRAQAAAVVAPKASTTSSSGADVGMPDHVELSAVSAPISPREAMGVDIDLTQPLGAGHVAAAASTGIAAAAREAMMGVEIDLTPLLSAEHVAAAASTSIAAAARGAAGVDIDLTQPLGAGQVAAAASTSIAAAAREAMMGVEFDLTPLLHAEHVAAAASTSIATAARGPAGVDIDLTRPVDAGHVAAAASTPIAAAAREAMDVDIDLSLPPSIDQAAMATPIVKNNEAHPAVEPASLPRVAAAPKPERKARPSPFGSHQVAMSEQSLDGVRGGFVTEGLNVSFGIERAVYVNGTLVTTTSLNVSDLGRIAAGRGTTAFDTGTLALIQSGAGNTVSTGTISAATIGTVVQNTLDGQKIQNLTVINATVNSLGVLRGINLQSSLRGAIIDSLRR